ncbi:MAG: hypothetical protein K2P75_01185 [Sphingobacteriaceae bacterium]|jgi:hypothetical protein|nr:hypothetical protein [Sphingobacteriaceae bacterium]
MKLKVEQPVALICIFTWIGFVCSISFLEAWLKFRAPGVTLPIGLGIGRLVFAALNKVEWVFALAIIVSTYTKPAITIFNQKALLFLALFFLITQTLWLLPALDARAQLYINGENVAPSNLHIYYVIAEFLKVTTLFLFGIKLFKND